MTKSRGWKGNGERNQLRGGFAGASFLPVSRRALRKTQSPDCEALVRADGGRYGEKVKQRHERRACVSNCSPVVRYWKKGITSRLADECKRETQTRTAWNAGSIAIVREPRGVIGKKAILIKANIEEDNRLAGAAFERQSCAILTLNGGALR